MDRPPPAPDAMLPPLRRLLRPLVRLMMRCGVTFPAACDLLRDTFVAVANEELGPQRTDSRVSLMTGVHRKEIRRQRAIPPEAPPPPLVTRNGVLIATWLGTPGYADAQGRPVPLPRSAAEGPSFERLVATVTRDVRPRAVLEDWLAAGLATLDEQDRVHLAATAFLPQPGREEQLYYFARNLHDHAAAAAANVLAAGQPPFLDRSVHWDGMAPDAAAALERFARATAERALLEVNREAVALSAAEPAPGAATARVNFGIYLLAVDETAP